MRRRIVLAALTLSLAAVAGTARSAVFAVVPAQPAGAVFSIVPNSSSFDLGTPLTLPSLDTPNLPGAITVPALLSTPPAVPAQLTSSQLLDLWQRAGAAYSIPWQVLAAINKVESNFGRNMGPSSAGAIGWMQFMPSTWLEWGVDADGDGVADPWDPTDAVYSAARYLAAAGGATNISRAVYAYNHADWYVSEVLGLANIYGASSSSAFTLDRLQIDLDGAQTAVVAANTRLLAAQEQVRKALRVEAAWNRRATAETLLSAQLADQEQAGLAGRRASTAQALVSQREAALSTAQQRFSASRQAAAPASFSVAASPLLDAPMYDNGYVFPVGGGPGAVSAAHTHHDYPAVDIAAAAGSPVYALADAHILRSWAAPDGSCGIGLTMTTTDGQTWTYCHLAYLQPTVKAGVYVTAGQLVGLVGATGDATGPHLHLQLQPPTRWPQDEQWFAGFAGTAFSWSDASTADSATSQEVPMIAGDSATAAVGPVFELAPAAPAAATPVVFFTSGA